MRGKQGYFSIRLKFFVVFMVLLIGAMVSVFLFFTARFERVYNRQADSQMGDVTSLSTVNIKNMVEQIDQLSVSVLVDQVVQDNLHKIERVNQGKETGSIPTYSAAVSRQIRGSVFNIDGIISLRIYSRYGDEIFIGTTNREYLEYSLTEDEIYQANGGALWGIAGKDHYVCMGRAILSTKNMQPLGYMVIICENDYFGHEITTVSSAYASKVYLVDTADNVVAASEEVAVGSRFPYPLKKLRDREYKDIEDPVSKEKSYYYTGQTLENGWTLVTLVSSKQFRDGIAASIVQMGMMLLTALVIALLITLAAVRKLTGPTQRLLESMSAFGDGRLDARVEIQSKDEIGQIGQAYNHMADNIQNLMERVYSLELANKEAEIEFLKMQINPHFLYNSLDTISWLGFAGGNEEVSDLAVSLANLLRSSIRREDMVTVGEEMEIVRDYLRIQNYRFGDKISVNCQIPPEVTSYYMPSFLLQPLIENSIIHGLENQLEKGTLTISIRQEGEWLAFLIMDDGRGMPKEHVQQLLAQCQDIKSGSAIGLKNVYRRLLLLYGAQCRFEIKSAPNKGTSISFLIPVILEKESADIDKKTELSVE